MEEVNYNLITEAYRTAKRRLFFLDYEGTLVPKKSTGNVSSMSGSLGELLFSLTGSPLNQVVVISNQAKEALEDGFSYLPLTLVAENGGFFRILRDQWQALYNGSLAWKNTILHALSTLSIQYKGSTVVKKDLSLAWNYDSIKGRVAPEELRQFQVALRSLAKKYGLKLREDDSTIEFTTPEVNKGKFASNWVSAHGNFDFILAIGDDWTDEDLFEAVGREYFTIKVGNSTSSAARYYLDSQSDVVPFLKSIISPVSGVS